jgi:glycerophosphoryl diester phosphodiesterase
LLFGASGLSLSRGSQKDFLRDAFAALRLCVRFFTLFFFIVNFLMPAFFNGRLLNLAHRGACLEAPENTLAAFRLAEAYGADGIELDVRMCRSGELVVIHDARLNRTTNGRGYVRTKTLEQLQRLDAGSHFHKLFAGETVPTLDEVLHWARGRMRVNIEIKSVARATAGIEAAVVTLVHRHRMTHECLVSSFNPLVLRRIARLDKRLATALLIDKRLSPLRFLNLFPKRAPLRFPYSLTERDGGEDVRRGELPLSRLTGVTGLNIHAALATEKFLETCKDAGLRIIVWGESRREALQRLAQLEIDGIITDEPVVLKKILEDNG